MRYFLPREWLGVGIVLSLLTYGCQHGRQTCSPCCGSAPIVATSSAPVAAPVAAAPSPQRPAQLAEESEMPLSAAHAPQDDAMPSRFAHDPNYHQLMGVVAYSRIQRAWLLRYAPIEDADRYGGSVTLVGIENANNLKDGQWVRVEGHLINPDSRQSRPAFEVRNMRPFETPH